MDQRDARKLTDAIKELTNQLRSGGGSPAPTSPSSPDTDSGSTESEIKSAQDLLRIRRELLENEVRRNEEIARLGELSEEEIDRLKTIQGLELELEEVLSKNNDEREEEIKLARESLRFHKRLAERENERNDRLEETEELVGNIFQGIMKTSRLKPDPKRGVAGFMRTILQDKDAKEEALSKLYDQLEEFKSLATPLNLTAAALEGIGAAALSAVTLGFGLLIRAFQAAIEFVIAMTMRFDALGSEIAKTTGHGREFAEEITLASESTSGLSTNMEEMMPALVSLSNQLAGTSGISRQLSYDFGDVAVAASRMGVSFEDTGKFIKDAMVGGRMSAEEAKDSFLTLNAAASALGKNFSELMGDFQATRSTFSAFGQNMEKVFLRSSSVARQLGMELNTVVGISDKFKTFDDAAAFVSEFNHMVGASLDPLEMMRIRAEEGPAGVAAAVKESLELSGRSFEDLSFAMREGIADNLGIPMEELRNMMGADLDMSMADEVANSEQTMDKFIQRGNDALTLMDKLGNIAKNVSKIIAEAFGFEKIAAGTDVFSAALKDLNDFVADENGGLRKFVNETLKPFVQDDLFPILEGVKDAIMSVVSLFGSKMSVKSTANAMRSAGVNISAAAMDEGVGYFDTKSRISAIVSDIARSNLSEKEKAKLLRKALANERSLADNDFEYLTDRSFVDNAFSDAARRHRSIKMSSVLKGMANGGPVLGGGFAMVGEKGPEIVSLPAGAYTIPNNAFARTGSPHSNSTSSSGGQPVQVNVRIDANDRVLKNAFTTTVEDVITGGA